MSSKFIVYRNAARRLKRHWLQGWYRNTRGDRCLTQAIIEALPYETINRFLPEDYRQEIHNKLWAYQSYRVEYRTCELLGLPLQWAIEAWNDTPGRRQVTVVRLLEALANDHRDQLVQRPQDVIRRSKVQDVIRPRPQLQGTVRLPITSLPDCDGYFERDVRLVQTDAWANA